MNRKFLLSLFVLMISGTAFAQVGVNTENPAATLDVTANIGSTVADGVIAPRLTGDQIKSADDKYSGPQTGAIVYATDAVTTTSTKTANITTTGYYYFDGVAWLRLSTESGIVLWAPSIVMPTSKESFDVIDTPDDTAFSSVTSDGINYTYTIDLYAIYSRQFTTPVIANPSAAGSPLPVYDANRLNYYVTYADSNIFTITSLTNDGKLSYTVNTVGTVTAKTFMNIVFKIK